jgi:hypothetical protein
MRTRRHVLRVLPTAFVFLLVAAAPVAQTSETTDIAGLARIRDEGINRSQVMDHLWWLSEVHGPRLTGSPALERASDWVMKRVTGWGLADVHQERFPFGKGWTLDRFSLHLVEPQAQPIIGYPKAWSASTTGRVLAEVVRVDIASEADLEKHRGTLKGKIVLTQPVREVRMLEGPVVLRMDPKMVAEAASTPIPAAQPRRARPQGPSLQDKVDQFLLAEGVVATLDRGSDQWMVTGGSDLSWQAQRTDGGTVFVGTGGRRDAGAGTGVPAATLAVEHYNRLARLVDRGVPVKVEVEIRARFHDEVQPNGINTIAEIPGTDLAHEVVILGAHLDSTHAATGATDNAAGSAAMMEAMRIIKASGVEPRRTIRLALWGGEEQGLLGARAYVKQHYADRQTMTLTPEHGKVAAYFNIDNGTGRIRGIWMQGNFGARPTFDTWVDGLRDLGVTLVGPRSVGSTDHVAFDEVGLPGFQFIQERLEYGARTHHSNMDHFDRVQRDDMVQMATVAAVFAYNAAMRDEKLPRKPLPEAAAVTR